MDWITCKVSLAGDGGHIMFRDASNPVSWPEVAVIQHLHGDESVFDTDFLRTEKSSMVEEKNRLGSIYGPAVVNLVYPGARPHIEADYPGDKSEKAIPKRTERRPLPQKAEV